MLIMAKNQSNETMKRLNASKEIEVMKCLTLHRIASPLYRLIASVAQLWQ
jgi:hypothetical protein